MTEERERIMQALLAAVREVNRTLSAEQRLEESADTVIVGDCGRLDSFGLVNFVVAVQQQVEEEFGVSVVMAEEVMAFEDVSVEITLGLLVERLESILGEAPHD